jgi:hypothetical protein
MNWKWMMAGVLGVLLGLSISPFEKRIVMASTPPANARFQIEGVTDEQPDLAGQTITRTTYHTVFLLDTESGHVWRFERLVGSTDKNGSTMGFVSVPVESAK